MLTESKLLFFTQQLPLEYVIITECLGKKGRFEKAIFFILNKATYNSNKRQSVSFLILCDAKKCASVQDHYGARVLRIICRVLHDNLQRQPANRIASMKW